MARFNSPDLAPCVLTLLVLYSTPRGFCPVISVFPSPQKPNPDLICIDLLISMYSVPDKSSSIRRLALLKSSFPFLFPALHILEKKLMEIKGINEIVICNLWYWNPDYAVEAGQIPDCAKVAASPVGTMHILAAVTEAIPPRRHGTPKMHHICPFEPNVGTRLLHHFSSNILSGHLGFGGGEGLILEHYILLTYMPQEI